MNGDLVERLRLAAKPEELASVFTLTVVRCSLVRDAANEIEALLYQIADMQAELEEREETTVDLLASIGWLQSERKRLLTENVRLRGLA